MKVIHVLRKPCAESTVAANVLTHGCGAINVDATRIQSSNMPTPTKAPGWDSYNKANAAQGYRPLDYAQGDAFYTPSPGGRWPANVVFQHLDGCKQTGVRQVKGSAPASGPTLSGKSTSVSRGVFNGVDQTPCYTDPLTGKETIAAYECAPGCPVAALDEQSGERAGMGQRVLRRGATTGTSIGGHEAYGNSAPQDVMTGYSDTGGASRFFKQFVGKMPVGGEW